MEKCINHDFYQMLWFSRLFSRGLYSYLSSQESVNSEIPFIEFLTGMSCQVTTFFYTTQCSSEFLCDWIKLKISLDFVFMVSIDLTASFPPNLIESSRFSWVLGTTPAKCDLSTDFADLEMMHLTDLDNISEKKSIKKYFETRIWMLQTIKRSQKLVFGYP